MARKKNDLSMTLLKLVEKNPGLIPHAYEALDRRFKPGNIKDGLHLLASRGLIYKSEEYNSGFGLAFVERYKVTVRGHRILNPRT